MVLFNIFIIKYLPENEFNSYIFVFTISVFIVSVVSTLSNTTIITSKIDIEDASLLLILQISIVTVFYTFCNLFKYYFEDLLIYCCLFSITQILLLYNITHYQRLLNFRKVYKIEFIKSFIILTSIVIIHYYFKNINAKDILLIQIISCLLPVLIFSKSTFRLSFKKIINKLKNLLSSLFKQNYGNLAFYYLILAMISSVDVLFLKLFGSEHDLSVYGSALRIYAIISLTLQSIQKVLLPKVAKQDLIKDINSYYKELSITSLIVLFPILLVIYLMSDILYLIFNDKFLNYENVFRILLASAFFSFIFSPYSSVLMKFKNFKFLLKLVIIALLFNILTLHTLYCYFGISGVATSQLLTFLIINYLTFNKAKKALNTAQ